MHRRSIHLFSISIKVGSKTTWPTCAFDEWIVPNVDIHAYYFPFSIEKKRKTRVIDVRQYNAYESWTTN